MGYLNYVTSLCLVHNIDQSVQIMRVVDVGAGWDRIRALLHEVPFPVHQGQCQARNAAPPSFLMVIVVDENIGVCWRRMVWVKLIICESIVMKPSITACRVIRS